MKNNKVIRYFIGAWSEIVKVKWPTKEMVFNHTVIVIISSGIAIMITAGIDYCLTYVVQYFVTNKG